MVRSSLSQTCRRLHHWWRRPSRKPQGERRHRPPTLETLETRAVPAGTWTPLVHAPVDQIGTMMLLPDGTVLAQGQGATPPGLAGASLKWYKLTPDASGSYINGTWSAVAQMHLARLYYGSNILPDGRVLVVGGEYSGNRSQQNWTNTGEIYDPVANAWTRIANFPQAEFGDDPTEVLPDGRVLAGYLSGPQTYIYDPATNTWVATPGSKTSFVENSDEESWVKLPDGTILTYDIYASFFGAFQGELYTPSTGRWTTVNTLSQTSKPGILSDPNTGFELGPSFVLPDGRAFFLGGGAQDPVTGEIYANTAYYTPSTRTWSAGPVIPNRLGADDAPGAMLPNGHILFAADHIVPTYFTGPTQVFEFDPTAVPPNLPYTDVTPTSSVIDLTGPAYPTRMLVLPTGQVLMSNGFQQLAVYTPMGNPNNTWRPTIAGITSDGHGTYTLNGTQLNGISEGAAYGDDAEMATNFPLVRLTATNGRVYYGRTFNWSDTGVASPGSTTPETTQFTLPATLPEGTYRLEVVANGIASSPVSFEYTLATHFSVTSTAANPQVANTPFSVTVRALNASNQTVTTYRGTVHFTSDDPQAVLPADYTFTAADNGVHTFTVRLRTAGLHQVIATDVVPFNTITGRALVNVSPANVDHLAVATTAADPQLAGAPFSVTVTAQDAYNNTVTAYTSLVRFASTDPQATLPPAYAFTANDRGVHTFNGVTLQTPCTQTVMAIGVSDGISGAAAVNVVTSPNATHFLVTTTATDPQVAGVPFNVTVTALNMCNATVAGYAGMVTFSSNDPQATLPPNYTFTAGDGGVHTFVRGATLKTAGSRTVTAMGVADGATGTATVNVMAAQANRFVVTTTASDPQVAGVPFSVTVTAQDMYGNVVTNYGGTIHFTSSDLQATLPPNYTFLATDRGVHTFVAGATLRTGGNQTITASSTTGSVTGTATVNVAVAHFLVSVTASDPQVAGVPFTVTVTAQDALNNTLTNYAGTVSFSSGDPQAALPPDYTFTAADMGVHTFPAGATLFTAGTWDVTATGRPGSITGTATVNVTAAAAVRFVVSTATTDPEVAGTPFDVTVIAVDAYDNIATTYAGTVHFSSGDPRAALPPDYTFTAGDAGVHVFPAGATLFTAGSWDVTATGVSDALTGSAPVNVIAAPAVSFYVLAPSSVASGTPFDVTVYALDPYGNIDTNYQGTVTFSSSDTDPGVVLPADYTFTTADAGIHTFTDTGLGEVTLITEGDQTLTVTDTVDATITGTATITVTAGPAPAGRRSLAVALHPAVPGQALALDAATANLERARVDGFFTAAENDRVWTVPSLAPAAGSHPLQTPHVDNGGVELLASELTLDQPLL